MDKNIGPLQEKLKTSLPSELLQNFEENVNRDFQKWEKEIQEMKSKKYRHDLGDYQQQPLSNTSLKVINLSDTCLTKAQESLLGLGLSFSPVASLDYFTAVKDIFFVCSQTAS